ncbi:hypothetical protein [Marinobacter sp. Arc7-DN-1]|uniref:hypothetical protein n=1 Tax=Marinobacter sp. Arc7-DN-1 TaxID=2304594 RepID=UPI000E43669F|nr:hypothetical protein [Marinobacter sp. Arc7-DN-1]AXS83635.1 hypothetical protein D0851_11675 [Marinobacter sp. Arc7-DN-1]
MGKTTRFAQTFFSGGEFTPTTQTADIALLSAKKSEKKLPKIVLVSLADNSFVGESTIRVEQGDGWEGGQKTWSARDGATEPYRDVFTGVFLSPFPASAVTTQIRNPGQSPGNNEPGTRQ